MAGNVFGQLFRYSSWGESHGPAIGAVIDGVPPRIPLSAADIQPYLDQRKPGQSRFVTQRREDDRVQILSGVFDGQTTGTPISLLIANEDAKSQDYDALRDNFRPGHADYAYQVKYGIRDYRGGGRASARETAARVAVGAIARKIIPTIVLRAGVVQIGSLAAPADERDWSQAEQNDFFTPAPSMIPRWSEYLDELRRHGSSAGAILELEALHVPPGLGAPVMDKLDADLAKAIMSINAVKAVEIGDGFAAAAMEGHQAHDAMQQGDGGIEFASNHAGGILGGISTGQIIRLRFAVKPTSSIRMAQPSVNQAGENISLSTKGRHDPCVGIRAAPIATAMAAITLADHWLRHKAQCL